ncbi:hypothetical protein Ddc_13012 [Ditylenchus destructor]|nr:hypothetical protein Ddc_13012 [Ditylenchus destructor]
MQIIHFCHLSVSWPCWRFVKVLVSYSFIVYTTTCSLLPLFSPFFLWYTVASLVTFGMYYLDQNHFPVHRNFLHCLEFTGGWPGALIAQRILGHEIRALGYHDVFETLVMWNVFLLTACGVFYNREWIQLEVNETVNTIVGNIKDQYHNLHSWFTVNDWLIQRVGFLLILTLLSMMGMLPPYVGIVSGLLLIYYCYDYLLYMAGAYVLSMAWRIFSTAEPVNPRNRRH